ncbi:FAD-dependent oxidoreductase [Dendrosporobacter sp. 1207_IL3150]|uniref:FAD-dependent oxidoreductase n=1 Tax=Dendrosporobacter sp. 1207_IL3150 TaxID=3084054 RepID=UPI002FDA9BD1
MEKIVIIGGVAAGLKAAAKVKRCNPKAEVTVIEKGELISYGACGLPFYLAGEIISIDDLMKTPVGVKRNPEYFQNIKDITVLTQSLATSINRQEKYVTIKNLSDGNERNISYDKLVIATGATPIKPNLSGINLKNVFQFWHPNVVKEIRDGLDKRLYKNAVIIGAGLIGLEVADALLMRGVDVTIVEMKDQIFPAFLDKEMAANVEKHLWAEGITLKLNEKVLHFNGEDYVTEVVTDKGAIPADLVIIAIGARPNVDLAQAAGLDIGPTGAIAVDKFMRTNDPDIYAGGDCVENFNLITGKKVFAPMGSTANKHGRVIGENLCGNNTEFAGVLNTVAVSMLGYNVGKTGLTERDAKELGIDFISTTVSGHDRPHYMSEAKIITTKLVVDANTRRVLGAQIIGEGDVTKRIDIVAAVITAKGDIQMLFDIDLSYAPPFNSPIDNVAVAANAIMNKLEGKFKGISSLAAKDKAASDNTVFLDVRTPTECEKLRIGDCQNVKYIPLGQLRGRLSELDKDQEIIAFCKISLRGYEAEVILEGEGFNNVKVLEGGLVAWPFKCEK